MTGNVVKAMRHCAQPIVAAVDGVCAGATTAEPASGSDAVALVARAAPADERDVEIGDAAVGDERLLAVEHVAAVGKGVLARAATGDPP
jgi:hypothetical protein